MASSTTTQSSRGLTLKVVLVATLMVLVAFINAVPASATETARWERELEEAKSWTKKHPKRLVMYGQEIEAALVNATSRYLVDNSLGTLAILSQNLTRTTSKNSTLLGKQYGTVNAFGEVVDGALWLYAALDNQMKTNKYSGSFSLQGSYNAFETYRTLPVISGTGDFAGAQGWANVSTVSIIFGGTKAVVEYINVIKYVVHFKY
jgi:hypothetical protein